MIVNMPPFLITKMLRFGFYSVADGGCHSISQAPGNR